MPNSFFQFKQFTIHQDRSAMKVTTDACLFGAWAAEEILNSKREILNVLDVGTGTGLLSLMIAQKNPGLLIDAIEIDEDACEQAKENVAASSFPVKISLAGGDVRKYLFQKKYDLIISNPPFYENEIISPDKKKNIAHHGEGLLLEELLDIIKNNLEPHGKFFLLLPFKRNEEIKAVLGSKKLFASKMVYVRQSYDHGYFRIMLEGSLVENGIIEEEISIWNNDKQYTAEFNSLLKEYYLRLDPSPGSG